MRQNPNPKCLPNVEAIWTTPKFSGPFSLETKEISPTYILEKFTPSLAWSPTYQSTLIGFNSSTEFSTVLLISTSCAFSVGAKDHKNLTRMSLWTSGMSTLSYNTCFLVLSVTGFGKVVKTFGSLTENKKSWIWFEPLFASSFLCWDVQ